VRAEADAVRAEGDGMISMLAVLRDRVETLRAEAEMHKGNSERGAARIVELEAGAGGVESITDQVRRRAEVLEERVEKLEEERRGMAEAAEAAKQEMGVMSLDLNEARRMCAVLGEKLRMGEAENNGQGDKPGAKDVGDAAVGDKIEGIEGKGEEYDDDGWGDDGWGEEEEEAGGNGDGDGKAGTQDSGKQQQQDAVGSQASSSQVSSNDASSTHVLVSSCETGGVIR
jgi:hypothetical protein